MSRHPRTNLRTGPGLATRLLLGQALVLLAGAATTWIVASVVGPGIFHEHLTRAHVGHTAAEAHHVDEAFNSALLISIGIASLTSVAAALAVSWYFSRRIERSISSVADAAAEIASGRFDALVTDPGLGPEFATLASTYNTLAARLDAVEATRRRMLGDLAHEMRTPLATIDAHLEAIEDGVRIPDRETLDVISASTRRLRRLAEDIGAVFRAEEGDPALDTRLVDAADLISEAAETARDRYAAKGVRLLVDAAAAGRVRVDPDRMGQVLGNLLDNALRHTPPGGQVTLSSHRDAAWVELAVDDTGEGIAAEHLRHVFDRFYRADTARDRGRGGSGIGLSIAKALVEAHGGGIRVTSDGPRKGATFVVRLPAEAR